MLIAQITDLHLGFDPENPAEFNRKRLDQVLTVINALDPPPVCLLATGDLVDRGDKASYRRLLNALGSCMPNESDIVSALRASSAALCALPRCNANTASRK